ncbi:hypothetical protein [Chloroflexus sp.]|uniref:hypothetical protein n=1 Tax=Chloroflexus sp. TaxID=1904827 RepID=UPI004049D95A
MPQALAALDSGSPLGACASGSPPPNRPQRGLGWERRTLNADAPNQHLRIALTIEQLAGGTPGSNAAQGCLLNVGIVGKEVGSLT